MSFLKIVDRLAAEKTEKIDSENKEIAKNVSPFDVTSKRPWIAEDKNYALEGKVANHSDILMEKEVVIDPSVESDHFKIGKLDIESRSQEGLSEKYLSMIKELSNFHTGPISDKANEIKEIAKDIIRSRGSSGLNVSFKHLFDKDFEEQLKKAKEKCLAIIEQKDNNKSHELEVLFNKCFESLKEINESKTGFEEDKIDKFHSDYVAVRNFMSSVSKEDSDKIFGTIDGRLDDFFKKDYHLHKTKLEEDLKKLEEGIDDFQKMFRTEEYKRKMVEKNIGRSGGVSQEDSLAIKTPRDQKSVARSLRWIKKNFTFEKGNNHFISRIIDTISQAQNRYALYLNNIYQELEHASNVKTNGGDTEETNGLDLTENGKSVAKRMNKDFGVKSFNKIFGDKKRTSKFLEDNARSISEALKRHYPYWKLKSSTKSPEIVVDTEKMKNDQNKGTLKIIEGSLPERLNVGVKFVFDGHIEGDKVRGSLYAVEVKRNTIDASTSDLYRGVYHKMWETN